MNSNEEILQELKDKVTRIEVLLEQQARFDKLKSDNLESRIKKLESSQDWTWKLLLSTIVTAVIGMLVNIIKF